MYLSVVCGEDVAWIRDDEIEPATAGTFLGPSLARNLRRSCADWPTGVVASDVRTPVRSDVPTLVISGDVDPVTPPVWGDDVARHLSHGVHLVLRDVGHVPWMTPCVRAAVTRLIQSGSSAGLPTTCRDTTSASIAHAERPRSSSAPGTVGGVWDMYWPTRTGETKSGSLDLCQTGSAVSAMLRGQGELAATGTFVGDSLTLSGRRIVDFTIGGRVSGDTLRGQLRIATTDRVFVGRRRRDANGQSSSPQCS
jgi:hypothetical protein